MPKKQLYVTPTSYAMTGPTDRAGVLKTAQTWADLFGWQVVTSPLLERYVGHGAWLPAADRIADMARALEHDVVWACRGGYGAIQLAQALLDMPVAARPALIGYSDVTVLHAIWRIRNWGLALYGSLPGQSDESRRATSVRAAVEGHEFVLSSEHEVAPRVLRPGRVQAPLFAACLVVLASLAGTPAMPDLRGCILALEDVDERPYAVDFALTQLYLAGALDGIAGLMFGSFHHDNPANYGGPSLAALLQEWADRLQVPAIAYLPFGHLDDQLVLPAGVQTTLEADHDRSWRLSWQTPGL